MVRQEVDFQEKRKLLESKISKLNEDIYILTEGESGKKTQNDDDIDEGLFQNMGRAISGAFSGAKGVGQAAVQKVQQKGQAVAQKFQAGADQKKLQYVTADIQKKQAELDGLKKQYQFLTGQNHNAKTAQNATAVARNKQGVVKAPAQKPVAQKPAVKKTGAPAKVIQPQQTKVAQ
jgi:uncharacterized protein YPO0396